MISSIAAVRHTRANVEAYQGASSFRKHLSTAYPQQTFGINPQCVPSRRLHTLSALVDFDKVDPVFICMLDLNDLAFREPLQCP